MILAKLSTLFWHLQICHMNSETCFVFATFGDVASHLTLQHGKGMRNDPLALSPYPLTRAHMPSPSSLATSPCGEPVDRLPPPLTLCIRWSPPTTLSFSLSPTNRWTLPIGFVHSLQMDSVGRVHWLEVRDGPDRQGPLIGGWERGAGGDN
jgi:hypothetical protein